MIGIDSHLGGVVHELSIARSIVEIVSAAALEDGSGKVVAVRVRIGVLSAIAPAALEFSYDVASRDTPLEGSRLIVRLVPALVYCARCNQETELPEITRFACAMCGTPTSDLRAGRDLEVESIEVV